MDLLNWIINKNSKDHFSSLVIPPDLYIITVANIIRILHTRSQEHVGIDREISIGSSQRRFFSHWLSIMTLSFLDIRTLDHGSKRKTGLDLPSNKGRVVVGN